MRLLIVAQDTSFFLPQYLDELLALRRGDQIDIAATSTRFGRQSLARHLWLQLTMFGVIDGARLAARRTGNAARDLVTRAVGGGACHSLRTVARRYERPFWRVSDIRTPTFARRLGDVRPDVVLAHTNQIVPSALLRCATNGWLNSHSSLLPQYRGAHPIFWALRHHEKRVGVTVHWMTEQVDAGPILGREVVEVEPRDTVFSLYGKCFALLPGLIHRTLSAIERGDLSEELRDPGVPASHFSFPTPKDIRTFRRAGRRML